MTVLPSANGRLRIAAIALVAIAAQLAPVRDAAAQVRPGGRLHLDYAKHDAARRALADGALLRRAGLGIDGPLGRGWSFEIAYDFAGDGDFKDAYVRYEDARGGDWTLGQSKVPFGLEELGSSNDTLFVERALPGSVFAPSRRLGVAYAAHAPRRSLTAMAYGRDLQGDGGTGLAARAAFAPVQRDNALLHLGAAVLAERPGGAVRYAARPESAVTDARLTDTGRLADVRRIAQLGLEAAWQAGPMSTQAEWMHARLDRAHAQPGTRLHGWYAMAGWVLTGESRRYRHGVFKDVVPLRSSGAWELTARYSALDLEDGAVRGGVQRNYTLGMNWYANAHVRVMLNYVRARSQRRGQSDDPALYLVRTQLVF